MTKPVDIPIASADWRAETLDRMRALILEAVPDAVEEVKWRKPSNNMAGIPVWSNGGIICTGETYKNYVKLTFAKGASLEDPKGLFNASLGGGTRRAIDIREGDRINASAFKALVKAAAKLNNSAATPGRSRSAARKARLVSGGNPQIAKADGDAAVRRYIAAMPGWKRDVGEQVDAIVRQAIPPTAEPMTAVKWNSPFYGTQKRGWFLSFHCFTKYVKVAFFNGASLTPEPPVASKSDATRYLHIHEGDTIDTAQLTRWVKQAVKIDGWKMG